MRAVPALLVGFESYPVILAGIESNPCNTVTVQQITSVNQSVRLSNHWAGYSNLKRHTAMIKNKKPTPTSKLAWGKISATPPS